MTTNSKLTNVDRVRQAIARMPGQLIITCKLIKLHDYLGDTFLEDDQIKRAMRSIPNIKLGQKLRGRRTPK